MNIKGKWEGYFVYGEGYVLPYFGSRVGITAEIYGDENEFTGLISEDDSEFSIPINSELKGKVEDALVSFVRTYDGVPFINENEENSVHIKEGNLDVEYQGYYDEKNASMYGSWVFEQEQEDSEGKYDAVLTGTWLLKKLT